MWATHPFRRLARHRSDRIGPTGRSRAGKPDLRREPAGRSGRAGETFGRPDGGITRPAPNGEWTGRRTGRLLAARSLARRTPSQPIEPDDDRLDRGRRKRDRPARVASEDGRQEDGRGACSRRARAVSGPGSNGRADRSALPAGASDHGDIRQAGPALAFPDQPRFIDRRCDRYEEDWLASRQPRIEDYLGDLEGEERVAMWLELVMARPEPAQGPRGVPDPGRLPRELPRPRDLPGPVHRRTGPHRRDRAGGRRGERCRADRRGDRARPDRGPTRAGRRSGS